MRVHEVAVRLRESCPPGARVLTLDPIYPLEAGLRTYPEFTVGRFIMHVGDLMTPPQRRRWTMAWGEELERVLAERPPDVILCNQAIRELYPPFEAYAARHGFVAQTHWYGEKEQFTLWIRQTESAAAGRVSAAPAPR